MRALVASLFLLSALSGCLGFLDDEDPEANRLARPPSDVDNHEEIQVASVKAVGVGPSPMDDLKIPVSTPDRFGQPVQLDAILYEPVAARALDNGSIPRFPILVFMHGFGMAKEMWTNAPFDVPPTSQDWRPTNLLEEFAQKGFIVVAYDLRGHGQSGGEVTVVGAPDVADLREVLDYVKSVTNHNGKVGLTGVSYGGGMSLRGFADLNDVVTAVPHQGWVDLYESLLPGNTPKLEWGSFLVAEGTATTGGRLHPDVYDWLGDAITRTSLAGIEEAMDGRSILNRLATDKPLFFCHGMTETLFPEADDLLSRPGFTRAYIHKGGHGHMDRECWDRTAAWFEFFLRGKDTGVDRWSYLETTDHATDRFVEYTQAQWNGVDWVSWYPHEGVLVDYPSMRSFTIEQRAANNPFSTPSAVWDMLGQPNPTIPDGARFAENDPTAQFFVMPAVTESQTLLGAPTMDLVLDVGGAAREDAWQATGLLYVLRASGDTLDVSHGAYTHKDGETVDLSEQNNTARMQFHFTKVDLNAGDQLVVKISANELGWFMPLTDNYSVSFTGESELRLPMFG